MEVKMIHKASFALFILMGIALSVSCSPAQTSPTPQANMPNPASVYCEQHGGKLEIVTAADGSQSGVCIFPDGSECDEWAYFRGECKPGDSLTKSEPTPAPGPNMPNPASVYCEEQGNKPEIVTAADGSQSGVCVFPDGSRCDEWAYFRGECGPAKPSSTLAPTAISTALPIDPADYQGWWTYTHPVYNFSIMLPEDWVAEEVTASNSPLNGHLLNLHPKSDVEKESIRMTFRRAGEETLLWPTGVGQGEFVPQGTLDVAGQPAQRLLLVCPSGEVTSIWYHQSEGVPNITRGDLEFGFIFSATPSHCEAGYSLGGKDQHLGEMIIASLKVP
jgi:putative hemolysin